MRRDRSEPSCVRFMAADMKILHALETLSPCYGDPVSVLLALAAATTNADHPRGTYHEPGQESLAEEGAVLTVYYARLLSALAASDAVVIFDEATLIELIRAIRPDVLVKGGDYTEATVVGVDEVSAWGGRVELVPLVADFSTTEIARRMRVGRRSRRPNARGKSAMEGCLSVCKARRVYADRSSGGWPGLGPRPHEHGLRSLPHPTGFFPNAVCSAGTASLSNWEGICQLGSLESRKSVSTRRKK